MTRSLRSNVATEDSALRQPERSAPAARPRPGLAPRSAGGLRAAGGRRADRRPRGPGSRLHGTAWTCLLRQFAFRVAKALDVSLHHVLTGTALPLGDVQALRRPNP
jgi:hypothetical protein